jgi:short-subunit dehydrogenase
VAGLAAQTVIVTGATSGIGRLAAIELAKVGANIGITARSQERAVATRAEIQAAAPDREKERDR